LLRNEGPFFKSHPVPLGMRHTIYRQSMRLHSKIGLQTFAVLIEGRKPEARRPGLNPGDVGWEYLLQRLERATNNPPLGLTSILLVHDTGEGKRGDLLRGPVAPDQSAVASGRVPSAFLSIASSTIPSHGTHGSRTSSSLRTLRLTLPFAGSSPTA
jgi:hypothetical protein